MPEASIRNRIRQDGFDESLFEIHVTGTAAPPPTAETKLPPPPDGKSDKIKLFISLQIFFDLTCLEKHFCPTPSPYFP